MGWGRQRVCNIFTVYVYACTYYLSLPIFPLKCYLQSENHCFYTYNLLLPISTYSRPPPKTGHQSGEMFGIIRRDPETVLVSPTTTRIPGRIIRTGTKGLHLLGLLLTVRAESVHSHEVTSSPFCDFANFRAHVCLCPCFSYLAEHETINNRSSSNSDPTCA